MNESHQAEGRAERLENRGGRIEAAGDGVWSVAKIHNGNSRWEVNHKVAVGAAEHRHSYSQPGNPEWWQVGKDGSWRQTANHAKGEFTFNDGRAPVRQSSWNEKRVTIQRHEDQIAHSQPGQIAIGGNFTADTQELANENGQILIGGVWQGSDKDSTLKNLSDLAGVYEIESGIFENSYARKSKSRQRWGRRTGYSAPVYNETLLERREFANHISYQDQAGSLNPPAGHAAAADAATAAVAPQRIKSPDGRFSLPESSLYTVRPDRPGYLVETDPAYADYRTWLGSDYMLKALQTDPNRTHKRLGDGYYEQRLINEQIARLTGYRRLDGYPNDEAQFKALMDAGISFARTQQLTPGIALSLEQVARLTSDIVWLESQTVTLADGSSQSVLVPKVYVLARPGDLNSAGGLISADALQLNAGRIDNRGTLAGRRIVDLAAGDISNSGRIGGKNVILDAQQQIDITGGSIEAERLLSLKADNITLQSSTAQSGDSHNGRTTVDRVAGLYVSGTEDGQGLLSLEAGHDIKLNGARLANRARDGRTQVVSHQGSVTLGTVRTESHESYGAANDKNHRHVHQSAEAGSRIEALGNITVSAGKDLNIRQGQIDSQNGRTTLAAQGNIDIAEGRRTLDLDESTYSKERGLVGSKSRLDQYRRQHDEAAGSVITGREVRTASGGDTRIRGSQVISDGQTLIAAQGEVRVDAAENRYQDWENHERKKSGLMGSGGIGFFIGNKTQAQESDGTAVSASGSTVGSLKGDTLIAAKRYSQTGSIVSSPEGNVLVEAEKIDIQAADERYRQTQRSRFEQKGLTVAVNIPVVDAAIGLTNAAKSAKQIHGSNSRVNLMAAANAARQGFNAGKTLASVAQNPQSASQGISVSITYGEQKNTSETQTAGNRAQAARMEAGKAVILKAHGAGKDSDILIRGADIGGQQATYLSAENRVDIRSAEQQHQERSKNRQSGWNAGVALAFNNGVSLGFTAGGNYGKGYGNGDESTHLHSHIGSRSGQTFVHSGGDTTLKGAQLIGKGVQLDAANLNIESVQDTATFRGKQENMSAQITVGYGFSAGGGYSRSKSSADHASVGEQSGIFAGEDGYQVNVKGHTDLKGALLTSAAEAEAQGKNSFRTATLSHSYIANHSSYSGSSLGVDGSVSVSGEQLGQEKRDWLSNVAEQNTVGKAIGYGKVKDNRNSITHSGINTRNLVITDDAGQQKATGMSAAQTAARLYTDINTDTAEAASGSLKNQFDKEAVQEELDRQREVTQAFAPVAAQSVAWTADKLGNIKNYEHIRIAKAYLQEQLQDARQPDQITRLQQQIALADQYLFEHQAAYDTWKEGGIGRAVLHAGAGALLTGDVQGAAGAGASSLAAPYLERIGGREGSVGRMLTDTVGGAAVGALAGGSTGSAFAGANADWNNRQLHESELRLTEEKDIVESIKNHIKHIEKKELSDAKVTERIRKQILRWVDEKSNDGLTDETIISAFGISSATHPNGKLKLGSSEYFWDYRDYAARNPQAYKNHNLFSQYSSLKEQEKLKNSHEGISNEYIHKRQKKNENLAANLIDIYGSFIDPKILARRPGLGVGRTLVNAINSFSKPTLTKRDPLLAGAGEITVPIGSQNRIPSHAMESRGNNGASSAGNGVNGNARPNITNQTGSSSATKINQVFNSIKDSPKYPSGFRETQNGVRKVNINNQAVLNELRNVQSGEWKKVYRDGFDAQGNRISIHYFQHTKTGRVFDVKVKKSWSN